MKQNNSRVNHPSHYLWLKEKCGIEVIDITRHMNFNLGNCIKYVLRSGHKSENGYTAVEKQIEDLKKAIWYLNDEIKMLEQSVPEVQCEQYAIADHIEEAVEPEPKQLENKKRPNKGLEYVTKFFK